MTNDKLPPNKQLKKLLQLKMLIQSKEQKLEQQRDQIRKMMTESRSLAQEVGQLRQKLFDSI